MILVIPLVSISQISPDVTTKVDMFLHKVRRFEYTEASKILESIVPSSSESNDIDYTTELDRRLLAPFVKSSSPYGLTHNKACLALLTGQYDKAAALFDQAASISPSSYLTWLGGALTQIKLGNLYQASVSLSVADGLKRGIWNDLVQGNLLLAQGDAKRALDISNEILAKDDALPLALHIRVVALESLARARDADKSRLKLLILAPSALAQPTSQSQRGSLFAGGNEERLLDLRASSITATSAFLVDASDYAQRIESRSNAQQTMGRIRLQYSQGQTAAVMSTLRHYGQRPGTSVDEFASSGPQVGWFQTESNYAGISHSGRYGTFHLTSEEDAIWTSNSSSPQMRLIRDQRNKVEYAVSNRPIQYGFSFYENIRTRLLDSDNRPLASPIEPSEQVLPNGGWRQGNFWAFTSQNLDSHFKTDLGLITTASGNKTVVVPYLNIGLKMPNAPQFTIKPTTIDTGSDLMPDVMRGVPIQNNPIDRTQFAVQQQNRSTFLPGNQGRVVDYRLQLPWKSQLIKTDSAIFHCTLDDVYIQGADPRTALALRLAAVSRASTTGFTQRVSWTSQTGIDYSISATYQNAIGVARNALFLKSDFPTLVPSADRRLGNFPDWQLSLNAGKNYQSGSINFRLEALGPRPFWQAKSVSDSSGTRDAVFVSRAPISVTGHVSGSYKINADSRFRLDVFNLFRAQFYPGYAGGITVVSGLDWRF